jgi:hypothetical protein
MEVFIRAPIFTTFCCEHVLKFRNELLQYVVFLLVQVRPGAEHHVLEFLQSPRDRRGCCWWSSNEVTHVTLSLRPMVVPSPSTWSWLVTFILLTGTPGRGRTNVLAICNPSREVFELGSASTFAAPRGVSNRAITCLSHRAGVISSLTRESRDDVGRAEGLHSVTFSCARRSSWYP